MLDKSANQTVTLKQAQGIIFINDIQMLKLGYWHYSISLIDFTSKISNKNDC